MPRTPRARIGEQLLQRGTDGRAREVLLRDASRRRPPSARRPRSSAGASTSKNDSSQRRSGERLLDEVARDPSTSVRSVASTICVTSSVGGERDAISLPEQRRGFADPVALVEARLQPFDARDVELAVATLPAGGPLGVQNAVPLLPLADRVLAARRCAWSARRYSGSESRQHLDRQSAPSRYRGNVPEGDSLHRAALRLQAIVGQRVDAESPHPARAGRARRRADRRQACSSR